MSQQPNFDPRHLMPPPMYPPRCHHRPLFRIPRTPGLPHWRGNRGYPYRGGRGYPYPTPPGGPRGNFLHPRHFQTPKVFDKKHKEKLKKQKKENCKKNSTEKVSEVTKQTNLRPWSLRDAERALTFEREYNESKGQNQIRIVFPDLELDRDSIRCLHPNIDNVFFKTAPKPRYCNVQLRPDADVEKVLADLNGKCLPEFGGKCLRAFLVEEKKPEVNPETIDPYTLYIGNMPTTVNAAFFREFFPNAIRKDVGHAQKLKHTRYAFVRFASLKESIDAFKRMVTKEFDSRSVIVRFMRFREKRKASASQANSARDSEDEEEFHYVAETRSKTSTDSSEETSEMEEYNPDEYDMDEINPPPRPPSLALLRFLRSNDEQEQEFRDFDGKRNVTLLPEDVISVRTTDSLLDLDTPYQ